MTDNELLSAISDLLDTKLEEKLEEKLETKLETKLKPIREDISELKTDVAELKTDVADLKLRQTKTELIIETEIRPNIQLLVENFIPAAKRYVESTERMDKMQEDIDVMKCVLRDHSRKLQMIS